MSSFSITEEQLSIKKSTESEEQKRQEDKGWTELVHCQFNDRSYSICSLAIAIFHKHTLVLLAVNTTNTTID